MGGFFISAWWKSGHPAPSDSEANNDHHHERGSVTGLRSRGADRLCRMARILDIIAEYGLRPAGRHPGGLSTHALLAKSRDLLQSVALRVDLLKSLDNGCAQFACIIVPYHELDSIFDQLQTLENDGCEITSDLAAAKFPDCVANISNRCKQTRPHPFCSHLMRWSEEIERIYFGLRPLRTQRGVAAAVKDFGPRQCTPSCRAHSFSTDHATASQ
jgi:hypothetical protein